jgi:hypothetical protein
MFLSLKKLAAGLLLATAASSTSPSLSAQDDPLISDRPDFTESTQTIRPGGWQLELGITGSRLPPRGDVPRQDATEAGELLLRIGLAERLELRLAPGSWRDEDQGGADGRTDGSIGVKVALFDGVAGLLPATSLLLTAGLPRGDGELRAAEIEPELKLLLAYDLTPRLSLASNLGVALPSVDGDRPAQGIASVSLGVGLGERVGTFLEVYGFFAGPEDDTAFVDGGFTVALGRDQQLDVRLGRELRGERPETFAGVGYAVRW